MAIKKKKKAEMPMDKGKSCCTSIGGLSAPAVLVIVLALVFGFLGGYMIRLAEGVGEGALFIGEEVEVFEPDLEKLAKIGIVMEKLALYNTGQYAEVTVLDAEKKTVLRVTLMYEGIETVLYVSDDYQTILGAEAAQDVDELETNLDETLASLGLVYEGEEDEEESGEEDLETQKEVPTIQLFIMSDCPAGNLAEDNLLDILSLLEDKLEFEPAYILGHNSDGSYRSLHGTYELNQDVREKIVYNTYGTKTWVEYVTAVNSQCNANTMEECWSTVAEDMELDVGVINTAFEEQFDEIVVAEIEKTSAAGVTASPTLIVNGQHTKGAKDSVSYQSIICNGFLEQPEECGEEVSSNSSGSYGSCGN